MPSGTITALRAQARDPQRVNLFIDDLFAIGVSLDTITRERLYVGKVLSEAEYARLERSEKADKAYHAALRYLESRPRSAHEVSTRLYQKGFAPEVIEQTIERLRSLDLIDDAAFARYWVERRQADRPRGTAVLRDELRRKGVDRQVIDAVVGDQQLVGDEGDHALQAARAVLSRYAGDDKPAFMRRLGGYLLRRGFTYDQVKPVIDQLWHEVCEQRIDRADADDNPVV